MADPRRRNADDVPETLDVLIIGAGFSGLYQLHRLRHGDNIPTRVSVCLPLLRRPHSFSVK